MSRYLKLLVLLALPAGWAISADLSAEGERPPAEDPAQWLVRMSEAVRQTTYTGVVVYNSAQRMESLRVLHDYRNGRVRERLTSLTGDAREIFRDNGQVICVLPEEQVITVDQRAHEAANLVPSLRTESLERLRESYRFEDIGDQRVADRHCLGMRVLPRDGMRYGYEYWLDAKTYLPLRVAVLDAAGQPIEQMMFTEVDFPEQIDDARFERAPETAGFRVLDSPREGPDLRLPVRWSLPEAPPGFRKIAHAVRRADEGGVPVEHFLYSDGLATISIYGSSLPSGDPEALRVPQYSRMGALNVVSRVVDDHQVTVVGEVPIETVQWIADRLQLAPLPVAELPSAGEASAAGSRQPAVGPVE